MSNIDPITGLPKELGAWENITKENQQITIRMEKRKFGKVYTIIEGLNEGEIDIKDLTKKLKNKFACGGTGKEGIVELQGNHFKNVREELIKLGFPPETVRIKER